MSVLEHILTEEIRFLLRQMAPNDTLQSEIRTIEDVRLAVDVPRLLDCPVAERGTAIVEAIRKVRGAG